MGGNDIFDFRTVFGFLQRQRVNQNALVGNAAADTF